MKDKTPKTQLLVKAKGELLKSLKHLEYSFKKTSKLELSVQSLEDEETLESFEGLSSRFARTSDIFTSRYLRTYVLIQEPGYRGSSLDYLNQAEKLGLIANAEQWTEIRELRNSAAHEYIDENLLKVFRKLLDLTPVLLDIRKLLSLD